MNVFDFWEEEFCGADEGRDYTGRKVQKNSFGRYDLRYGWVIERIGSFGSGLGSNLQIVNVATELARRGRNSYDCGGKTYRVERRFYPAVYDYTRKDYCMRSDHGRGLWECEFGCAETGADFAGVPVRRGEFGGKGAAAWNVDHIRPLSRGGTDDLGNLQITAVSTNSVKADLTEFTVGGVRYRVVPAAEARDETFFSTGYDFMSKNYCVIKL